MKMFTWNCGYALFRIDPVDPIDLIYRSGAWVNDSVMYTLKMGYVVYLPFDPEQYHPYV
jgi:hypothetical protein